MRCEQMGSQPVPVRPRPTVLQRGAGRNKGAIPSIDLQDAKASRAQDDANPYFPAMPDPADATINSPVDPTTTLGPRRSTRSTQGVAPQRLPMRSEVNPVLHTF